MSQGISLWNTAKAQPVKLELFFLTSVITRSSNLDTCATASIQNLDTGVQNEG